MPRETLAALLWERDHQHARLSLRNALSTLCRTLGDHAALVHTGRHELGLNREALVLDADLLDSADPATLLALWRGPFLSGLVIRDSAAWDDWHSRWDLQLSQRYLSQALTLARAALEASRPDEAAHLAERALALDPLSVQAAHLLIDARRQAGQTSAARLFRSDFLKRYAAEYGSAPDLPPPEGPRPQVPVAGPPAHHLPRELTPFIGRAGERARVHDLVHRGARLITLHGPGGIGKTRLAQRVAWDLAEQPRGIERLLLLPFETCAGPAEVPARLAGALNVPLHGEPDPVRALARHFGPARVLVALDNLDELLEATPFLLRLLDASPGLTLLVTSRERLRVREEHLVTVAGLPVPGPDAAGEMFDRTDAVQLFVAQARQVGPFHLTAQTRPLVRRICLAVGGSPLGVELAAAWTGVLPLEELVGQLERGALHLDFPLKDVPDRHRSLGHALDASWQRLSPQEQQVLARLSVFRGGFTWDAAREVASATPAVLAELTAKALITLLPEHRFRFHPLVRNFAAEQLGEEETAQVAARHAAHFRATLDGLNRRAAGAISPELVALFRNEEANVMAALRWLLARRAYPDLARIAEPLLWAYPLMGRFRDGLAFCEAVLAQFGDREEAREARLSYLIGYAWLTLFAGDVPRAVELGREVLNDLGQEDSLLRLRALDGYGQACGRAFELAEARGTLLEAQHLARRLGDPTRLMRSLNNLGLILALQGAAEDARRCHGEAYALYRSGQVPPGMDVIWLLSNIAVERMMADDLPGACRMVQEGLDMTAALGLRGQEPILRAVLGLAQLELLVRGEGRASPGELEEQVESALDRAVASGETFARALLMGVRGALALRQEAVVDGGSGLLGALTFAWETQNLLVFHWLLPYAPVAMLRLGDGGSAARLHTFLTGDSPLGTWNRRRAEREWAGASGLQEADGCSLEAGGNPGSLAEVARLVRQVLEALPVSRVTPASS